MSSGHVYVIAMRRAFMISRIIENIGNNTIGIHCQLCLKPTMSLSTFIYLLVIISLNKYIPLLYVVTYFENNLETHF